MNGKTILTTWGLTIVLLLWTGVWGYGGNLKLNIKKVLELGSKGEPFFELNSVCEDDGENFYILDKKRCIVRKFSKDGKELLSFGGRGEGPQEWMSPSMVFFSQKAGIVVTEMMNCASIFTMEGKLINKFNFSRKGGLLFYIKYLGGDIFYGVSQRGMPLPKQVLMDSSPSIVNSDLYASNEGEVKMPDGSTYSDSIPELFPTLIFESYNGYGIAGLSDKYELKLLNSQGKAVKIFLRDVEGKPFTEKEREYFATRFRNEKEFPPPVQKKFVDQIPKNKMYFYTAKPTSKYVLVFRIKADTTTDAPPYPVDVFSINGEFLGEVDVHKLPLLVTDKYMYFEEGDENNQDELILLIKYSYELIK